MKNIVLFGLLLVLPFSIMAQKTGYNIKVTLKDYMEDEIYLGFTLADKKYLKDTAKIQKKGVYVFEGKEALSGGVFFIYTPTKLYFELLIDENQHFSIESDTLNFVKNAKITNSPLNSIFFDFVTKAGPLQTKMTTANQRMSRAEKEGKKDSVAYYKNELELLDKELKGLQDNIINNHPNLFFTKLLKSLREPEIPETPLNPDGTKDSLFPGRYYKQHFWDNFDFTDNKLAYSEVFHNKLKVYFSRFVVPQHDSLVNEAQRLFNKTENSFELKKYMTHFLYVFGDTSKIMGAENLAVFIGKNYYNKEKATWADSASLAKIKEHVNSLEPLILGKKAPNLRLADTTGQNFINMANIRAKYTVLVFWDPTCGHCQKELPKLQTIYEEWKPKGLEIFGIYTQREIEEWKKFIRDKKLTFLQGAVFPDMAKYPEKYIYEMRVTDIESLNLHKTYYITSTPQIYLLDENKNIIGRRLSAEALPKLLEAFEKMKENKK